MNDTLQRSLRAIALAILGIALTLAAAGITAAWAGPTGDRGLRLAQVQTNKDDGALQQRARTGDRPPALTDGRGRVGQPAGAQPRGAFDGLWAWLMEKQQQANRQIVGAVKDLKAQGSTSAAFALILVSFIYGVLHAAGPGHGKAVISSYVLANERTVRRGIMLSFLAAFIQALSAIAIVTVLVVLMRATSFQIKGAEHWIATLSWGLIALLGAWLVYGQIRILWRAWSARGQNEHDHACDHVHVHGAHAESGECCGHAHMPDAKTLEDNFNWRKGLLIAGSVGIRPCTGAVLVLIFALTNGLLWAGVVATFAMALGTAITVSVLAATAVGSRTLLTRMAGGESPWGWRIERAAGLIGSVLVFALGASFFAASLGPAAPF